MVIGRKVISPICAYHKGMTGTALQGITLIHFLRFSERLSLLTDDAMCCGMHYLGITRIRLVVVNMHLSIIQCRGRRMYGNSEL